MPIARPGKTRTVYVTGDTYPHRAALDRAGCKYDRARGCWTAVVGGVTAEPELTLRTLRLGTSGTPPAPKAAAKRPGTSGEWTDQDGRRRSSLESGRDDQGNWHQGDDD